MQIARLYQNCFRLAKLIPEQKSNVYHVTDILNQRPVTDRLEIYALLNLQRKIAEQRENTAQMQEYDEILDHYNKNILD